MCVWSRTGEREEEGRAVVASDSVSRVPISISISVSVPHVHSHSLLPSVKRTSITIPLLLLLLISAEFFPPPLTPKSICPLKGWNGPAFSGPEWPLIRFQIGSRIHQTQCTDRQCMHCVCCMTCCFRSSPLSVSLPVSLSLSVPLHHAFVRRQGCVISVVGDICCFNSHSSHSFHRDPFKHNKENKEQISYTLCQYFYQFICIFKSDRICLPDPIIPLLPLPLPLLLVVVSAVRVVRAGELVPVLVPVPPVPPVLMTGVLLWLRTLRKRRRGRRRRVQKMGQESGEDSTFVWSVE